jgi:hypothetical protein
MIDLNKLNNVQKKGDKTTAQCPVCAKSGGDSKGAHLVIYPTGEYGCVAYPEDSAHRKAIFKLVGTRKSHQPGGGPIPIRIRRPVAMTRKPRTLLVLKRPFTVNNPTAAAAKSEISPAEPRQLAFAFGAPGPGPTNSSSDAYDSTIRPVDETEGEGKGKAECSESGVRVKMTDIRALQRRG